MISSVQHRVKEEEKVYYTQPSIRTRTQDNNSHQRLLVVSIDYSTNSTSTSPIVLYTTTTIFSFFYIFLFTLGQYPINVEKKNFITRFQTFLLLLILVQDYHLICTVYPKYVLV